MMANVLGVLVAPLLVVPPSILLQASEIIE